MKYIKSEKDETYRLVYEKNGYAYYCVAYYNKSRSDNREYVTLCLSTQIGCVQKCRFCATGDYGFIENLSPVQISEQIRDGLKLLRRFIDKNRITEVHVIFEGMGEASDNFVACEQAFDLAWNELLHDFDRIIFRISSVGKTSLVEKYIELINRNKYNNVIYEAKLSLHTIVEQEREYIFRDKYLANIKQILNKFLELARATKNPLICNYMLLEYPNGNNNYDLEHLSALADSLVNTDVILLLGKYSDTGKGFVSPQESIYIEASKYMQSRKIETYITELKGNDICAACGMLNYS